MFRKKVLDVLLGARMKPILNGLENSGSEDSEGIPAQVAESVLALKKAALMDDHGVKLQFTNGQRGCGVRYQKKRYRRVVGHAALFPQGRL